MKKILFLVLLFHFSAQGQMLNQSNKWNDFINQEFNRKCKCTGGWLISNSYTLGKDTLLKNRLYKELYDSVYQHHYDYPDTNNFKLVYGDMLKSKELTGYVAEENNKVYFISYYTIRTDNIQERLLYDFNLAEGDIFNGDSYKYIVKSIDSADFLKKRRKVMHLTTLPGYYLVI